MVCGYLPFEDQNTKKLYQKIIKAEYKLPETLSESCQDLIQKILNPDPRTRLTVDEIR
jgi:5'-AMP-activated protein kinase catalytic alpha subunit